MLTQRLILRAIVLSLVVIVAGCAAEPLPVPPSDLQPIASRVNVLRLWSLNAGDAGRGYFEPQLQGEQLVVANRQGRVSSVATDTGMRQWTTRLKRSLTSGVGGDGERVYVSDNKATVYALDAKSGDPLWEAKVSSEVLAPVSAGFGHAIVRSTDGRVVSLDPATGEELWSVSNTPPVLTLHGYSRPLVLDGGVLVGLDDGRLLALNADNGKLIWESVISVPSGRSEVERLVDIDADLQVDDEGIYLANYQGKATKVEPARGQVVWSQPMSAGSGIALDATSLIIVDDTDTVHRLDKQTGQIIWSNDKLRGRRLSPPGFTPEGDTLVVDFEGYLHVLDAFNGELIGRSRLGNKPVQARPLLQGDAVFIQSTDGSVAAYRFAR